MKLLALILIFIGIIKCLCILGYLIPDVKIQVQTDTSENYCNFIVSFIACDAIINVFCGIVLFSLL